MQFDNFQEFREYIKEDQLAPVISMVIEPASGEDGEIYPVIDSSDYLGLEIMNVLGNLTHDFDITRFEQIQTVNLEYFRYELDDCLAGYIKRLPIDDSNLAKLSTKDKAVELARYVSNKNFFNEPTGITKLEETVIHFLVANPILTGGYKNFIFGIGDYDF